MDMSLLSSVTPVDRRDGLPIPGPFGPSRFLRSPSYLVEDELQFKPLQYPLYNVTWDRSLGANLRRTYEE